MAQSCIVYGLEWCHESRAGPEIAVGAVYGKEASVAAQAWYVPLPLQLPTAMWAQHSHRDMAQPRGHGTTAGTWHSHRDTAQPWGHGTTAGTWHSRGDTAQLWGHGTGRTVPAPGLITLHTPEVQAGPEN